MIQRIKDLMNMNEQIDVIKNNLNYTTSSVSELKTEIETLKQHIDDNVSSINSKNTEFFRNFDDNIAVMRNIKQDFEKELFDFKLLRSQIQKKIIEKFEEELDKELQIQIGKLRDDSEKYNELKESISQITDNVNNLSEEISKFTEISKNIKKEDFELTKFANQVREADKEKLELMSKIDSLQRLVSKIRRQEYITR